MKIVQSSGHSRNKTLKFLKGLKMYIDQLNMPYQIYIILSLVINDIKNNNN